MRVAMNEHVQNSQLSPVRKRIVVLLAVVAVTVLGVHGTSRAGEMIHNGGFEFGTSGWDGWHCTGSGVVGLRYSESSDTRPGTTGSKSLQIDTTSEFSCSNTVRQMVRGLTGERKYRMSIWCKMVSGGALHGPVGRVVARDMKNDTNEDRRDLGFDMTTDSTWKYISERAG